MPVSIMQILSSLQIEEQKPPFKRSVFTFCSYPTSQSFEEDPKHRCPLPKRPRNCPQTLRLSSQKVWGRVSLCYPGNGKNNLARPKSARNKASHINILLGGPFLTIPCCPILETAVWRACLLVNKCG